METDLQPSTISGEEETLKKSLVDDDSQYIGVERSYRTTKVRWLALLCACMLMVGNYMSYDFPTYLQSAIGESVFGCKDYSAKTPECNRYNSYYPWLYSIYSFPNFILPLFGGFFIDKIGVRVGLIVFTGILMIGQLVCSMAGIFAGHWSNSTTVFVWFFIGRFIFALGGENQTVTQSTIVSKWFLGKELAFALGTNISCARLGSVLGGFMFPAIYNSQDDNLTYPLFTAEAFCILSFGFMLIMVWMDRKADQQEGRIDQDETDPSEQVSLKDITTFPLMYWLLCVSCLLNYVGIFVFLQFANGYLQYNYQDSDTESGRAITIPYFIAAGLTPFIGILADKIGKRQYLLFASSTIMFLSHLMWILFPKCPQGEPICSRAWQYIPLVFMGLFYSCYAAVLWPCIPLVLNDNVVGTGFGVATAVQNFGLFLSPLLVNQIIKGTKENQGGYFWSEFFFCVIGITCVLLSVWIIFLNARTGNKLGRLQGQGGKKSRASQIASFRK